MSARATKGREKQSLRRLIAGHVAVGVVILAITLGDLLGGLQLARPFAVAAMAILLAQGTLVAITLALMSPPVRVFMTRVAVASAFVAYLLGLCVSALGAYLLLLPVAAAIVFILLNASSWLIRLQFDRAVRFCSVADLSPPQLHTRARWSIRGLLTVVAGAAVLLALARLVRDLPNNPVLVLLLGCALALVNAAVLTRSMLGTKPLAWSLATVIAVTFAVGFLLAMAFAHSESQPILGFVYFCVMHNAIVLCSLAVVRNDGYRVVPLAQLSSRAQNRATSSSDSTDSGYRGGRMAV